MDRSSLKFVQEVQEAKAMDDLMDKIDKLMGGSPGTEHTGTGKFEFFFFNHNHQRFEFYTDSRNSLGCNVVK